MRARILQQVIPVSAQPKTGTHQRRRRRSIASGGAVGLPAALASMGPGFSPLAKTGMTHVEMTHVEMTRVEEWL